MSSTSPVARAGALFLLILSALALLFLGSCATSQDQGDIPWNEPQPWEGQPNIPIGTY